jgi:hypothetical protein
VFVKAANRQSRFLSADIILIGPAVWKSEEYRTAGQPVALNLWLANAN